MDSKNTDSTPGDGLDEATTLVSRTELNEMTELVDRTALGELSEMTELVDRTALGELSEMTELVDRTLLSELVDIDESTIALGTQNAVEEATLVSSEDFDEQTTSAPRSETKTFEASVESESERIELPPIEVPTEKIEVDAKINVETYVDPDEELKKTRSQKLKRETDEERERLRDSATDSIKTTSLHDAALRAQAAPKKNGSRAKIVIVTVLTAALLYGAVAAIVASQG